MKWRFKKKYVLKLSCGGFTLAEVMTSLIILALLSSSVLVVINRCMKAAADSELELRAFEVARENLEQLLTQDSVSEGVDYGESEIYPDIEWSRKVETFYEPITDRMWVLGTCRADYLDTSDEEQYVELTHWLTDLSKNDIKQLMAERLRIEQLEEEEGLEEGLDDQEGDEEGEEEEEEPEEEEEEELEEEEEEPERLICGKTWDEIMQMGFGQMLQFYQECPEFGTATR
ncbi:MAG: prepilin-type N-terminal cleavage/methylation domain-containing protein [Phycisphaerae bacterium]|nr:prepilin-type N-terminal cleavage/methylation domain-containing protein [Phycisphaerae bacterium]